MSSWTHRMCERCWFDGPGKLPDGYRQPTQVMGDEPDYCCYCGGMCITSIYSRADPATMTCLHLVVDQDG